VFESEKLLTRKATPSAARARARKVKLILFDVDGVLTDGTIWFVPIPDGEGTSSNPPEAGHDISRVETKGFHAQDGIGISLARLGQLKTGIVTKRMSEAVALRARDLKLDFVFQGITRKPEVLDKIVSEGKIRPEEICYVGDDIIDIPIMRLCGLAIAVANARPQVREIAHYTTPSRGGEGAARDVVEYILKAQNKLEKVVDAYLNARS
jgi:3-deoxy-D-manno-octulosonate 8-phosphate phosphatase (KDO 8-P phosphatase)